MAWDDFVARVARTFGKTAAKAEQAYKEGTEAPVEKSGEELLQDLARRLELDTKGKSLSQIADEIFKKSSRDSRPSNP